MNILFFARDPGAADVIGSIYDIVPYKKIVLAKDYARGVFSKKRICFNDFNKLFYSDDVKEGNRAVLQSAIDTYQPDLVVTGTSHFEDLSDRLLWELCEEKEIPSIAVLDQWLRFRERFIVDSKRYIPDYVLAPSQDVVENILAEGLCKVDALVIGSPFLSNVYRTAGAYTDTSTYRDRISDIFGVSFQTLVTYISEPQRMLTKKGAQFKDVHYDEIEVYHHVADALEKSSVENPLLVVKLHPKEDGKEYEGITNKLLKDQISKYELIAASDIVIGTKSMLLIESLLFGKTVLSIDFWNLPDEQLITNQLGLTTCVQSEEDLLDNLNSIKRIEENPKTVTDVLDALGVDRNWESVVTRLFERILTRPDLMV